MARGFVERPGVDEGASVHPARTQHVHATVVAVALLSTFHLFQHNSWLVQPALQCTKQLLCDVVVGHAVGICMQQGVFDQHCEAPVYVVLSPVWQTVSSTLARTSVSHHWHALRLGCR